MFTTARVTNLPEGSSIVRNLRLALCLFQKRTMFLVRSNMGFASQGKTRPSLWTPETFHLVLWESIKSIRKTFRFEDVQLVPW